AADGQCRSLICSGSAPESQVDAPGVQGGKGTELFGNDQRSMVGKHNSARSYPDGTGTAGNIAEQNGGGRTRHIGHIVMLGHPETFVAGFLCLAGKIEAVGESVGRRMALAYYREVKYRKGDTWRYFMFHGYNYHF